MNEEEFHHFDLNISHQTDTNSEKRDIHSKEFVQRGQCNLDDLLDEMNDPSYGIVPEHALPTKKGKWGRLILLQSPHCNAPREIVLEYEFEMIGIDECHRVIHSSACVQYRNQVSLRKVGDGSVLACNQVGFNDTLVNGKRLDGVMAIGDSDLIMLPCFAIGSSRERVSLLEGDTREDHRDDYAWKQSLMSRADNFVIYSFTPMDDCDAFYTGDFPPAKRTAIEQIIDDEMETDFEFLLLREMTRPPSDSAPFSERIQKYVRY